MRETGRSTDAHRELGKHAKRQKLDRGPKWQYSAVVVEVVANDRMLIVRPKRAGESFQKLRVEVCPDKVRRRIVPVRPMSVCVSVSDDGTEHHFERLEDGEDQCPEPTVELVYAADGLKACSRSAALPVVGGLRAFTEPPPLSPMLSSGKEKSHPGTLSMKRRGGLCQLHSTASRIRLSMVRGLASP